jgi:hypothetical protein
MIERGQGGAAAHFAGLQWARIVSAGERRTWQNLGS